MQKITIPNYLRKVQLTNKRRKTYWVKSAITPENPLPVKFSENRRYGWKVKKGYGEVLYDFVEMDYVIKNAKSHDKPRYQMIAGNELYAKMHERKRIAVMEALHEHFEEHIRNQMEVRPLNFPVRITMELYRNFGQANWDTDNMWVYHKAFLDTMRDCGYLPEDSVIYVRESGGTKFIPIKDHETPTMIFVIEEIQDVDRSKTLFFFESSAGKPGDICVKDEQIIFYTGKKKLIYGRGDS